MITSWQVATAAEAFAAAQFARCGWDVSVQYGANQPEYDQVAVDALPRMYLATPGEIASWLKTAAAGRGDTILYEEHVWTNRAKAAGTIDRIPALWKFTEERLDAISVGAEPGSQLNAAR
jgi:hypothetical protein